MRSLSGIFRHEEAAPPTPEQQRIALHNAEVERRQQARDPEQAIAPGSRLAQTLARLSRHDRRLLLAVVQAPPGRRRARMEARLVPRLLELKREDERRAQ